MKLKMSISVGVAQSILALVWIVGILYLLIVMDGAMSHHYFNTGIKDESSDAWKWLFGKVGGAATTITTASIIDAAVTRKKMANILTFICTIILSLALMRFVASSINGLNAPSPWSSTGQDIDPKVVTGMETLHKSDAPIDFLQSLVLAFLGAYFVTRHEKDKPDDTVSNTNSGLSPGAAGN